jgi:hypothetical protein
MPTPEYCLLGIDWWPLCMTKAEWSGWMQAVFSVAAIVFAGAFAMLPIRAARQDQVHARRQSMRALIEVIATLTRLLSMEIASRAAFLESQMSAEAQENFLAGNPFADVAAAANAIPVHEQHEVTQVRLVFALRRLTALALYVHAGLAKELGSSLGDFLITKDPFALVQEALLDLERQCQDRVAELT